MLQKRTGIKLVAIPLRAGAGGKQIDLINGAAQVALQNAATVTPPVKAGKIKRWRSQNDEWGVPCKSKS